MEDKKSQKGPETQNHLVVILEDMRSKFRVFGEGLSGLREEVKDGFAQTDKRLCQIEEKLERVETDVRIIKNQIKVKVDLEEFKLLENRLVIVEKRLAALSR